MATRAKSKGVDRISSLPDPILCHILSFLPGNDAVRTSILSSRWRYLFNSMSTFDFNHYHEWMSRENMNSFKNFVDRIFLYTSQVSLECFRVHDYWLAETGYPSRTDLSRDDDYLRLLNWICAALWRGIKEFDINLHSESVLELPSFLFTCQSLVTLKLRILFEFDVPANICLPNLKTLHLEDTAFCGGGAIHRLISRLHVLEDLVITTCYFRNTRELNIHNLSLKRLVLDSRDSRVDEDYEYVIAINTPSLVYFQYIDILSEGYTLISMDSPEKTDIVIDDIDDFGRGATQLLQGICNVRSLCLTINGSGTGFSSHLSRWPLDPVPVFHNLVELKFHNDRGGWKGTCLVEFLHCMPNLQKLILRLAVAKEGYRALPEEVPSCLLFHLKEITISHFKEDEHMLELVSYFFNNAVVLEKLLLGIATMREKQQLSIFKKLMNFPKNSKKCQVLTF